MDHRLFLRGLTIQGPIPEESYIARLPAVRHIQQAGGLVFRRPVTFFVGENGVGKSTLIEAIALAAGFNAEGGTVNFNFATRPTHSDLYRFLRLTRGPVRNLDGFFLRAESFYNVATNLDDLDDGRLLRYYGGTSLHAQSHGESFLSLVEHRFGGHGLYILDEPEAALSPMKLMTLMVLMDRLVKDRSQFLISTHSPILMTFPGAEIYELSEEGVRLADYRDTAHFQIARRFLDAPERMLEALGLGEDMP